jgi:uncharacterized protein (DUF2147 family)
MMKHTFGLLILLPALACPARARQAGITGQWTEPTGSVIRVDHCGDRICMWIVEVSKSAPAETDIHNPDPAMRSRALCGMEIGSGFELQGPDDARNGTLYDPKTGKTYRGSLQLEGEKLELRGYVGIPLFGKSQIWTRPVKPVEACTNIDKSK